MFNLFLLFFLTNATLQNYSQEGPAIIYGNALPPNNTIILNYTMEDIQEHDINEVFAFLYNINYKFYYYPRGNQATLKTMEGDCTDISAVGIQMLKERNITAKQVHGWARSINAPIDITPGKHDWIQIYNSTSNTWYNRDDYFGESTLIYVGEGHW